MKQQINAYIDLVMEHHKAVIYVAGKEFNQCSFLVANLNQKQAEEIDSIDKLATVPGVHALEGAKESRLLPDETILFGHASNLIAWCENGYDTRILHSNLSFPLLKALAREGDAKAKRVLQGEIIDRLRADFPPTSITILATCSDVMDKEAYVLAARSSSDKVKIALAWIPRKWMPYSVFALLAKDKSYMVRSIIAGNVTAPQDILDILAGDDEFIVRFAVASNTHASGSTLAKLARSSAKEKTMLVQIAKNESAPPEVLDLLLQSNFMDWRVTPGYCRAVAHALGLRIYFSWRIGGYRAELLRENSRTMPIQFETPQGLMQSGGIKGELSTRRRFPAISNDLNIRWCSSYLKIECGRTSISRQPRFHHKKILLITGERAEESRTRAAYNEFEIHHCDARDSPTLERHVDAWRPVHKWSTQEVWEEIKRYSINPHPCYRLGWGRCSCAGCIFSNANQYATLKLADPECFWLIANYEHEFGKAIKYKKIKSEYHDIPLEQFAASGIPYAMRVEDIRSVNSPVFQEPMFLKHWILPRGAYGEMDGPT